MSKKVQKTLTATLVATLATGSMGMPAFAKQNNKDLDATYKAAYEATVKTQDLNKVTQGDINIARRTINELRGTSVESAIPTFSSIVDKAQQKFLEIAYNSILKCQKTGLQRDINIARSNIENLPEQFKNPYSMAIDIVQQKLIDKIYEAVQKAEETLKGEDLNKVQSLLNDLKTAVYNEGIKTWAIKYEETNINPLKVKCGYKVQLNNTKLDIYKDNKDGIPNTTKITVYKLDSQRKELGLANNANIEVLDAKGNNAEKEKEISIKENTIEGLKDGTYVVKVKIGDYLVKQITITVVNTAPRPSTITFKSKTATVYSGITLENLLSDLEYSVKDQFGGLLNNKLVGIKYKVENKNAATINPISKDGQYLEDQIRYTLFDNEGRLLNQGNFDLAIESITVKDSKMANGEKVINFSTPMVIKVIVNSGSGDSSESTKPIVKPDQPHTNPEVNPEKPESNKELLKQIEEKGKAALKALKDAKAKTEGVNKDNVTIKIGEEAVSSAEKAKAVVKEYTDLVNANKKDLDTKIIDDAEQKTEDANEQLKKADGLMEDATNNLIKEVTAKRDTILDALKDAQGKTLAVHKDNVTVKTAQEAVSSAEKVVTMVKDYTDLVNANKKYLVSDIVSETNMNIVDEAEKITKEANEQLKKANELMEQAKAELSGIDKNVLKDQASVKIQKDAVKALKANNDKLQNTLNNETAKYNKIQEEIKPLNSEVEKLKPQYNEFKKQAEDFQKLHDNEEKLTNKRDNIKKELEIAKKNNQKVKKEKLEIELKEVEYNLEKVQEEIRVNNFKEDKVNQKLENIEDALDTKGRKLNSLNLNATKAQQNIQNAKKDLNKSEANLKSAQNLLVKYEDKLVADLDKLINAKGQFKSKNSILSLNTLKENKANLSIKTGKNGINEIVVNTTVYTLQ